MFLGSYLVVDVMTYCAGRPRVDVPEFHRRLVERERTALTLEARAATLEAQMHEARLNALRMELHPHFLFNTLNAIAGLVRRWEGDKAVAMLSRLGTLLRLTLEGELGHEVRLDRELELLDLYLHRAATASPIGSTFGSTSSLRRATPWFPPLCCSRSWRTRSAMVSPG